MRRVVLEALISRELDILRERGLVTPHFGTPALFAEWRECAEYDNLRWERLLAELPLIFDIKAARALAPPGLAHGGSRTG